MKVTILGTGSWGTALAKVLADNQVNVQMWGIEQDVIKEINDQHQNSSYLPGLKLAPIIKATNDLEKAVAACELLVFAVPTKAIRKVAESIVPILSRSKVCPIIMHVSKGLEQGSHLRISQVIEATIPRELYQAIVVLSGPSHAEEVAKEDITTITAASTSLEAAQKIQTLFMNDYFRVYTNTDVIGVEMGAALKNIIALASGILHGLDYGDNAKAALITRGLAEITRLGIKMGADVLTFSGLSGVGDLIVTCTSVHSRNWQAGNLLAQGYNVEEVEQRVHMVVEGIFTTKAAYELSQEYQVDMPITAGLYQILYEGASLKTVIQDLMGRPGKQEASLASHQEEWAKNQVKGE